MNPGMSDPNASAAPLSGRTAWARGLETPLRAFLRTETGSAAVLLAAATGGMVVPIAIYLALNLGRPSASGWGAAMSTDTAFALGMLALVAPRAPDRLRAFLLTIAVIDDLVAIGIIAIAYSQHIEVPALLVALGIFAVILLARAAHVRRGLLYAMLGIAAW